jgi:hypothetical protein
MRDPAIGKVASLEALIGLVVCVFRRGCGDVRSGLPRGGRRALKFGSPTCCRVIRRD